ncbi:MAG: GC-type dockerin domain-anchored protein [Phycisphaerales bacterium JB040]
MGQTALCVDEGKRIWDGEGRLSRTAAICVTDDLALVLEQFRGLLLYDVSDPLSPSLLSESGEGFGGSLSWIDQIIDVSGSLASIKDANSTGDPDVVRLYEFDRVAGLTPVGAVVTPEGVAHQRLSGTTLLIATRQAGEVRVVDVGDPAVPVDLGTITLSAWAEVFLFEDGLLYVVDRGGDLTVWDLTDPGAPVVAGSRSLGVQAPLGWGLVGTLDGGKLYVGSNESLVVCDVTDPGMPVVVGSTDFGLVPIANGGFFRGTWMEATGGEIFFGGAEAVVLGFDVSVPESPSLQSRWYVGSLVMLDGSVVDGRALISSLTDGMLVVDVREDSARPALLGRYVSSGGLYTEAFDFEIVWPYGFVGYNDALYSDEDGFYYKERFEVFDLSDPGSIEFVAAETSNVITYDPTLGSMDASVNVLVSNRRGGLVTTDLNSLPELVSARPAPGDGIGAGVIAVRGSLVFGTMWIDDPDNSRTVGWGIIDITDPLFPVRISEVDTPGTHVRGVEVSDSRVYVAHSGELLIYEYADPASPTPVGSVSFGAGLVPFAMHLEGTRLIVSLYHQANPRDYLVLVLDISDPDSPVEIGRIEGVKADEIDLLGDRLYTVGIGLRVFDLSDPSEPREVGIFHGGYWQRVIVRGSLAYATNDAGWVSVLDVSECEICTPDVNRDGVLDNGDIGDFVSLFLAGDLAADITGDGILDNGDIRAFVAGFLAGC